MNRLELYVLTHAHWLFWGFTAWLIIGAMAIVVSVGRPKRQPKPARWP